MGGKYEFKKAVFPCSGGLFAFIVTSFGTLAMFFSSAIVMPLILGFMIVVGIAPNGHC